MSDITPRVLTTAPPGSTMNLVIRAVLLGGGICTATVVMPDGTERKLKILLDDPNMLFNYRSH